MFFTTSTHRVDAFDQSFFGGKYFYMYLYTLEPWRLQIGVCALSTLEIGLRQLCSVTEMAPITLLRVNTTHASSLQSVHYRCVCLYFIGREGAVLRFFVGFDWLATQARLIRGCFSFSQLLWGGVFSSLSSPTSHSLWLTPFPPLFWSFNMACSRATTSGRPKKTPAQQAR